MSDTPKLGELCDPTAGRDAVHIAIAPVKAAEPMGPGTRCGLNAAGEADPWASPFVGIVDPFLPRSVRTGERFYLCLFPNTVTSLRHVWTHPVFAVKVPELKEPAHVE